MKVLICIYRDDPLAGGSVRVAEVLARSVPLNGIDLYVAVAYGGRGRVSRLLEGNSYCMGAKNSRDFGAWRRFRDLVKQLSPDIVHYVDSVGWMVLAGVGLRPKRVMHQHFRPDVGPKGKKRFFRLRWLYGPADGVVAISHGAKRNLVEKCHISEKKITVIHNAIDGGYINPSPGRGIAATCILGMAVRMVKDKGVEDALHVLKMLPARYHLVLAGDGPDRDYFVQIASDIGIAERVLWLGMQPDINVFFSKIDFYLYMSWYEGFGLSVAEAMMARKPVVGLLGDGEIAEPEYPLVTKDNSILVRRSAPLKFGSEKNVGVLVDLCDRIKLLDLDFPEQTRLKNSSYSWIESNFSAKEFSRKICLFYNEVLTGLSGKQGN